MRTKQLITITAILVLALAVPLASAYADHGKGGCSSKGRSHDMFTKKTHMILMNSEALGLSTEQVQAVKALGLETERSAIREEAEIKITGLDLAAKMHEYPMDAAAVKTLVDQKYELKKAKTLQTVEAFEKLQKILTKEQYEKLHTLFKDRMKHKGPGGPKGAEGPKEK
jgi:Spy/CpxP family protein refolding chaperone